MQHISTTKRKEAGFTLVELAIVMIIIGLLIGGILKGQELITNARVAATVTDVKGISTALNTFRDSFNALPGDINNPGARLPGCTAAPCNVAGNADSRIGATTAFVAAAGDEATRAWSHLAQSEILGGADGTNAVFGQGIPQAKSGGGHVIGYFAGGATLGRSLNSSRGGHYVTIQAVAGTPPAGGAGVMPATEAARFDRKIDDGNPRGGSAFVGQQANCETAAGGAFDEANDPVGCGFYIRL